MGMIVGGLSQYKKDSSDFSNTISFANEKSKTFELDGKIAYQEILLRRDTHSLFNDDRAMMIYSNLYFKKYWLLLYNYHDKNLTTTLNSLDSCLGNPKSIQEECLNLIFQANNRWIELRAKDYNN